MLADGGVSSLAVGGDGKSLFLIVLLARTVGSPCFLNCGGMGGGSRMSWSGVSDDDKLSIPRFIVYIAKFN